MTVAPRELARTLAQAADDKKARDVLALDVSGFTSACEDIVVCTAPNEPLARSVVDEVERRARECFGVSPLAHEGRGSGPWSLVDFGSVVVHVLSPEGRDFYRIERLWGDAPRIEVPGLGAQGA